MLSEVHRAHAPLADHFQKRVAIQCTANQAVRQTHRGEILVKGDARRSAGLFIDQSTADLPGAVKAISIAPAAFGVSEAVGLRSMW